MLLITAVTHLMIRRGEEFLFFSTEFESEINKHEIN